MRTSTLLRHSRIWSLCLAILYFGGCAVLGPKADRVATSQSVASEGSDAEARVIGQMRQFLKDLKAYGVRWGTRVDIRDMGDVPAPPEKGLRMEARGMAWTVPDHVPVSVIRMNGLAKGESTLGFGPKRGEGGGFVMFLKTGTRVTEVLRAASGDMVKHLSGSEVPVFERALEQVMKMTEEEKLRRLLLTDAEEVFADPKAGMTELLYAAASSYYRDVTFYCDAAQYTVGDKRAYAIWNMPAEQSRSVETFIYSSQGKLLAILGCSQSRLKDALAIAASIEDSGLD